MEIFGLLWLGPRTTTTKTEITKTKPKKKSKKKNKFRKVFILWFTVFVSLIPEHTYSHSHTVASLTMPFCTGSSFHLTYNAAYSVLQRICRRRWATKKFALFELWLLSCWSFRFKTLQVLPGAFVCLWLYGFRSSKLICEQFISLWSEKLTAS